MLISLLPCIELTWRLFSQEEIHPLIGFCWCDFEEFRGYDIFRDERIVVHPALQIRPRRVMRHDPTAQIRLKTVDHEKYAVVTAAFDPFGVAFHDPAGLASVAGRFEQDDEHQFRLLDLVGRCLSLHGETSAPTPPAGYQRPRICSLGLPPALVPDALAGPPKGRIEGAIRP